MGTFRIQALSVASKSGLGAYAIGAGVVVGVPPDADLVTIANRPPGDAAYFATTYAYVGAGDLMMNPDADGFFLDGSATPVSAPAGLPPGFNILTARVEATYSTGTGASLSTQEGAHSAPGGVLDYDQPVTLAYVLITPFGVAFVSAASPGAVTVHALRITGTYDILFLWWTIPAVNACGVRAVSHLQYVPWDTDPGAPWVRLDPDDPDAAPTPVVVLVTPDHGVIAGGVAVTITGSGFGDGATVAFDGVPATAVVVVSQYEITCVTPAHAAGTADVVVTNDDGVSS